MTQEEKNNKLLKAVWKDNLKSAARALELGADVNYANKNNVTLLMHAALVGAVEITQLLIVNGASVNARTKSGNMALHHADNHDVVQILIDAGAEINVYNQDRQTPLMSAAFVGNLGVMTSLLKAGADTDIKDNNGCTAGDILKKLVPGEIQQVDADICASS